MPAPKIDWLDPTDEQVIALIEWYVAEVTDKKVELAERVGYAAGALRLLKKLLETRIDWRKQQRGEFRELAKDLRAMKRRDAAWEAGSSSHGEI